MGYSRSVQTLINMLPHLELLHQDRPCKWTTEPGGAHKFAYKLREALYIARLYAGQFPELARAADRYRIEILSDRQVQARPAAGTTAATVETLPVATVTTGMEVAGGPRQMSGPQSAASIMQTWLDAQPTNDKFYFAEARLSNDELLKLHRWAKEQKLLFFVDDQSGGLNLQKEDRDLADFAWSPEDLNV